MKKKKIIEILATELNTTISNLMPFLKNEFPHLNTKGDGDITNSEYCQFKEKYKKECSLFQNLDFLLSSIDSFFPVFDVHYYYGEYYNDKYYHDISDIYISADNVIGDFIKFYNLLVGSTIITLITGKEHFEERKYGSKRGVCYRRFREFLNEQEECGTLHYTEFGGGAFFIIPISDIEYGDSKMYRPNEYKFDEGTHKMQQLLMKRQSIGEYSEYLAKLYKLNLGIVDILRIVHQENKYNKAFDKVDFEEVIYKMKDIIGVKQAKYLSSIIYINTFLNRKKKENDQRISDIVDLEFEYDEKKYSINDEIRDKIRDVKKIKRVDDETTAFFRSEVEVLRKKLGKLTNPKDIEETELYIKNLENQIRKADKKFEDEINQKIEDLMAEKERKLSELKKVYSPKIRSQYNFECTKLVIQEDLFFALKQAVNEKWGM